MKQTSFLSIIIITLLLCGCASVKHGTTYPKVKDQLLVTDSGLGAKRLDIESRYDATVKGFIEAAGKPNYIYVESQYQLLLVYLDGGYVAQFDRPLLKPISSVSKSDGIPKYITKMIEVAKANPRQEAFSFSD